MTRRSRRRTSTAGSAAMRRWCLTARFDEPFEVALQQFLVPGAAIVRLRGRADQVGVVGEPAALHGALPIGVSHPAVFRDVRLADMTVAMERSRRHLVCGDVKTTSGALPVLV